MTAGIVDKEFGRPGRGIGQGKETVLQGAVRSCLLALFFVYFFGSAFAESSEQALSSKLEQLVLPSVDFTEATLDEAVAFCVRKSQEIDPDGRGLNIIASPQKADQPRPLISLRLRDVPLGEVLRYIAILSEMDLSVELHSVVFRFGNDGVLHTESFEIDRNPMEEVLRRVQVRDETKPVDPFGKAMFFRSGTAREWLEMGGVPFPDGTTAHYEALSEQLVVRQTRENLEYVRLLLDSIRGLVPPEVVTTAALRERMGGIVVPNIDFTDATLEETIDFLRLRASELAAKGVINLVIVPPISDGIAGKEDRRPITMQLKDVPLGTVLNYVAEFSDCEVHIDPYAIVIAPHGEFDWRFVEKSFPVRHPELRERLSSNPKAAREWLETIGVALPDGAGAYFEPIGNNLIVRNLPSRIRMIEMVLGNIEQKREAGVEVNAAELLSAAGGLTADEEAAAIKNLLGFSNAKSVAELLQFVRDPERVKPLMKSWLDDERGKQLWEGKVDVLLRKKIQDQGRDFVIMAVELETGQKRIVAFEQKGATMLLDWETAVGYQPMPLDEFKFSKPRGGVEFRVKVKPSDYYNFQFSDKEKFKCVELSYPGDAEFKLFGYIETGTEWSERLFTQLSSGNAPSLIVKLKYPEGEIRDDKQVLIESIVAETWWP